MTNSPRKGAVAFVLVTVALDMLALGIIVPILPKLILSFRGGNFASAAIWTGIFGTIFALMQFVVSPILGVLSDRFGRRPVILLSNAGTSLDYVVMALARTVWWLLIGRVISGITTASISVASAYIADVTPAEKRAGAFGYIAGAFGFGFVVGPAIGGWLGSVDPRLPFWVAAALSALNFAYGFLVLPESLAQNLRNTFAWRRANPLGSLKMLRSHPELAGLSWVSFITYVAHEGYPNLFVLYTIFRYGWNEKTIGLALAVVGVSSILISSGVVRFVVTHIGERRALIVGLIFGAVGYALSASSSSLWFLIAIPIGSLQMIASSAEQAIMTRRVGVNEQGELQGALGMLRSVAMLIGPLLFTLVFAYSVSSKHAWRMPSAPWLMGAALVVLAAIVAWLVTKSSDDGAAPIDLGEALQRALPNEVQ